MCLGSKIYVHNYIVFIINYEYVRINADIFHTSIYRLNNCMSFKVHLIHDLYYGFNEPTDPADLELPECDLVILNGNIAENGQTQCIICI